MLRSRNAPSTEESVLVSTEPPPSNKEPILKMLEKFEKDLNGLKNAIVNNDKEKLFNIFDNCQFVWNFVRPYNAFNKLSFNFN